MSALPFFVPPQYTNQRLSDSDVAHKFDFFLPQTFGGGLDIARSNSPQSCHIFDTFEPTTIARNAVLKRIVDAARGAEILKTSMTSIGICFIESFGVIFPGHGLVTFCQHRIEYPQDADRICDELARLDVNSVNARYQLTLHWTEIHDRLTREFDLLMDQCNSTLQYIRGVMNDPVIRNYANRDAVFKAWCVDCLEDVNKFEELLHDHKVVVPPTIKNVLLEISQQIPAGEHVQIITSIDGVYQTLCTLTTDNVHLAHDGKILAEVERRSSGPGVDFLLERLTL